MTTLTKIISGLSGKSKILLIAIFFLFSVINCQAAMPKRGESIRISGTISDIGSKGDRAFVVITLEPRIDTGDRGWPKCETALIDIKMNTEDEGKKIVHSLFDKGDQVSNVPIKVDSSENEFMQLRGYFDPVWIKKQFQEKMAQRAETQKAEDIEKEKVLREKAKMELEETQAKLRKEEGENRIQAETQWQKAQTKIRIEEEEERIREQRIADLKSGKLKITNIEDAKLAFNPSTDDQYTVGLPIDGLTTTGQYFIWAGTLSWKSGKTYYCLDSGVGANTKCFGFTDVIVKFNEMRENSHVTVGGKLSGTSEVTLTNKLSGAKENKKVAVLADCYVF